MTRGLGMLLALVGAAAALPAQGETLGDSAACRNGGPAIRVEIIGLKDRSGGLKLELYPATEADFLKDDRDLIKQGKFFRRIRVPTPADGPVSLCIGVPQPGRYALLVTHDRAIAAQCERRITIEAGRVSANESAGQRAAAESAIASTAV